MRVHGICHLYLGFDLGFGIDLDRAEARVREGKLREHFRNPRRAPEAARPRSRHPLHVVQTGTSVSVGRHRTEPEVHVMLYEFAAAAVSYRIPIDCPLEDLVELADAAWGASELIADARRRMADLLKVLGDTVQKPELSEEVEDYLVFNLRISDGTPVSALWTSSAATVASILRAETQPLSDQEISDAVSHRCAYLTDEIAIVDWFASLLVGVDMDDERAVLQLGVVELLQLRLLDGQMDKAIDEAYLLMTGSRATWQGFRQPRAELQRLSQFTADAAILFEAVANGMKLLGDQYLARLYRTVSDSFHLTAWERSIERKLETLGSIFAKLDSQAGTRRMELLEAIIILLFVISILMSLAGIASE